MRPPPLARSYFFQWSSRPGHMARTRPTRPALAWTWSHVWCGRAVGFWPGLELAVPQFAIGPLGGPCQRGGLMRRCVCGRWARLAFLRARDKKKGIGQNRPTYQPTKIRRAPHSRSLAARNEDQVAGRESMVTRRGPGRTHGAGAQRQPGPFYTYTCLLSTLLEYEFGGDISCLRTQLPPTPDRLRAPRLRVPSPPQPRPPQRVFLLLYRGERLERRL